ncbi:hypothetical protein [Eubacterium sp.]|uniref:hypothetical protein n=1 Tax=Eubacterium sp. TaxID=142586 RepID=UPI003F121F88
MKNKKKSITIITALIIIIAIVLSVFGIKAYLNKKEQKYIESYITSINGEYSQFEAIDNRTEKLNMLKTEIDKYKNYKNADDSKEEIVSAYDEKVKLMKQYFITDYDSKINDNTIAEIKKINDKKQINSAKKGLADLLELIKTESQFTLNQEDYESYQANINDLIKSYDSRLKEIKEAEKKAKEEAERKAREEAEKKAKEETERKAKKSASKNKSGSNSSGKSDNKVNTNGLIRTKWYDADGNLVADNYTDGNGHLYDLNGNRLENDEGWW